VGSVKVEFGENILFDSGQAETKNSASPILLKAADLLKRIPYTIIVEGHTDDVPLLPGGRFKDNRELSMARAMCIIRILIDQAHFKPDQLAAAAYGSYRPRSSNLTDEGRRMNRRIELALVKNFPYPEKKNVQR